MKDFILPFVLAKVKVYVYPSKERFSAYLPAIIKRFHIQINLKCVCCGQMVLLPNKIQYSF